MKKLLATSLLFGASTVLASPFIVQKIEFKGIPTELESTVLAKLPVKVGKKASENDIARTIGSLYREGYEQVEVMKDGKTLVISVEPKYTVSNIIIKGSSVIPDQALLDNLQKMGVDKGEPLNRERLAIFRKELLEHYKSVGRYNAKVKTDIEPISSTNANIKITIDEDDVAKLKSITFKGNHAFSASELEEQIELSPDAWWKIFGAKFESLQFGKDLETLRAFYMNHGYPKMQISNTDVQLNDEKTKVNVTIDIDEGAKYNIINARVVGDVGSETKPYSKILKTIHLGEEYRQSDIQSVETQIKALLGEQGYANPEVSISPKFNDEKKTVEVTFVVDAGHRYTVRNISFEGNHISADSTLRQEMRQQEGAWLSSQKLELGKARLERTGFFDSVELSTVNVPGTTDQIDAIYKVRERKTGSINFGIGYGTESGFSYNAGIKQDNFLGLGSSLSLSGSRNDYGTNVSLGYNEPYFTKDGVSLGGNVYFDDYDNSKSDTSSKYAKTSYGISGTLGFPVNENNSYYLGLGYANNKLKNVEPEFHRALYAESMGFKNWTFKTQDYDFSFGWNYNSLNRGFFPTDGVRASIGGKVTLPMSDNKYYKINADVQAFYPLDREHQWVLKGKASFSFADGFGGKRLPFYQSYSAGGIGSLRGFEYGAIGPKAIYLPNNLNSNDHRYDFINELEYYTRPSSDVVGGNAMALASAELIVPTPFVDDKNQTSVRTSLFVDAASVWSTHWKEDGKRFKDLPDYGDPSRVRASTGVALQWNSPIGPLVFSYAKPLKKYKGDEIEQFQFSVGTSF